MGEEENQPQPDLTAPNAVEEPQATPPAEGEEKLAEKPEEAA